jgi:hypothetical protein
VLKWKFLLGKRNRRLDHLVHTLVERVVPYYALKQSRQDSNFEGPDIETKKHMAILKRAEKYTEDQIQQVGDSMYTVASESQPARVYDVDVDAYSCSCLDFPLISFCKHIAAVQRLFDEPVLSPTSAIVPAPSPRLIPAASNHQTDDIPTLLAVPPPRPCAVFTNLAAKLETAAARLRKTGQKELNSLTNLEATLDAILLETDNSSVLPSSSHISSSSCWRDTLQAMLPNRKPGQKHHASVADKAYGAGASSGRKAKESGEVKRARLRYTRSPSFIRCQSAD